MEGTYEVTSAGQAVGTVMVSRQGLYCHFACRCHLTGEIMFRLILKQEGQSYDLGILIPRDGCFGLDTRLAAKTLGEGIPQFFLKPKHGQLQPGAIHVCPEEPFAYLDRLENAYLITRGEEKWIDFREEK